MADHELGIREAVRLESWNSDSGETQIDRKVMFNKRQDLKLSSHLICVTFPVQRFSG